MATAIQNKMRFVSRPYQKKMGLIATAVAVLFSWPIVAISYVIASSELGRYKIWGPISLLLVGAFATYILILTYRLIRESRCQYELTIEGDRVSLTTIDQQDGSANRQQVSLSKVISAEYFEPRDSSSLLLKGDGTALEIPLWSFGPESESKIVAYVRALGVNIVGIPNDIVF